MQTQKNLKYQGNQLSFEELRQSQPWHQENQHRKKQPF
jgi:hypothetical protein